MSNLIVNSQNKLYIINNKALEFKDYIQFKDPEVRRICAETWGDGNGLEKSQAAQVTDLDGKFYENTEITSFDELRYFTGLTTLENTANYGEFYGCTALESVTIPQVGDPTAGNNGNYHLHRGAFRNCSSLKEVTLNDIVNRPGAHGNTATYMFAGCSNLTKVNIESLESWLDCCWGDYSGTYLTGPFDTSHDGHLYLNGSEITSVTIPSSRTILYEGAFRYVVGLTSVVIPSSVVTIEKDTFYGSGITSLSLPSSVTSVGATAFKFCTDLISVVLTSTSLTLGQSAFEDCSGITSISLPANVTLGFGAFRRCTSLQTVTLNGSFTTSGSNCFSNDTVVSTLNISSLNDYCASTVNATHGVPTAVTNSDVSVYEIGSGNEITALPLPSTMTAIPNYMFRRWAYITSVTFPQNITSIGNEAFLGCTGLTGRVVIPSTVTSMGTQVFKYCSGITDFIFNSTIQLDSSVVLSAGDSTGEFYAAGDVITGYAGAVNRFEKIQIDGDLVHNGNRSLGGAAEIRIGGNVRELNSYAGHRLKNGGPLLKFLEIGGTIVLSQGRLIVDNANLDATESIMHLKYNGIACTPDIACASYARLTKIYVDSQAVLDQYLADSDWSQYSSKLDLWSNYNGPYKA